MSRRPNIVPTVLLNVALPEPVYTKLNLFLFSELEGRIPLGAYQRFLSERIQEYFSHRQLDLAPFAGTDPGAFVVSGAPEALEVLQQVLTGTMKHEPPKCEVPR